MGNGVYLWRITGYARHLENARDNVVTALHSPPFYTNFYGYKFCLRLFINGVDTPLDPEERCRVSLFVHMMQSDWDDTLEWPFSGKISLSILDRSDAGEYKRHISETLVTRPNLLAFQRPTTPRNHIGYGYVDFTFTETLHDRQYLKNDCLVVRVQVHSCSSQCPSSHSSSQSSS
ncbi:TNF receptor-associated factor 6-like [Paramuricea clavata]|nr:TNF receptor-associated factor 6-like [Paramuricea clavata]